MLTPRALRIPAFAAALALVVIACGGDDPGVAIDEADPQAGEQEEERETEPEDEEQATEEAPEEEPRELEPVDFALNFLPVADTAGWFTALDKGWFAEEGLDVEIHRGFGSGNTVQRVATGEVTLGTADLSALIPLVLEQDVPVRVFASYLVNVPQSVFYWSDLGISEPTDLEGHTVVTSAGNANLLLFPAFASATGIDQDQIEWVLVDPGSINAVFAAGETDAALGFQGSIPIVEALTDREFEVFSYAEHGVDAYATMFIAHEQTIEEQPELLERFLRAAFRGLEYALENSDESLDILLRHEPDNDPDITRAAWEYDKELSTNEDTGRYGFGYISHEKVVTTFDTLVIALDLDPGDYTAEDLYTTSIIDNLLR